MISRRIFVKVVSIYDYKKLDEDYKRLNMKNYKSVIKDTMIPLCDWENSISIYDKYDGEYLTDITSDTIIKITKYYFKGRFIGFNIYADEVLLETKDTKRSAKKYVRQLKKECKRKSKSVV